MNSVGSYSANLSAGLESCSLICARQGEVSTTMGSLPPSEAFISASSSSLPFDEAVDLKPRLLKIMPQHCDLRPSGYTTS